MPEYEVLINNELFMKYWNTFENNSLADKKAINIDINMFYDDLIAYVNSKREKELNTFYLISKLFFYLLISKNRHSRRWDY